MLPISSSDCINNRKIIRFKGNSVSSLIQQGDAALNANRANEALTTYKKAQSQSSSDVSLYKKIGKAYYKLKNYDMAAENFQKYLEENSDDVDCLIELGETLRQKGNYEQAIKIFEKACSLDKSNDLAKRSLLEAKNNLLSAYNPERAAKEKNEYAAQNLKAALDMTVGYMTPEYMADLKDLTIKFDKTSEMSGTANIAQYENSKNCVTVSDRYIYAAPQVIAAYLAHESVHAKDNDPYTSIREEQDAYAVAAKFWIKNANGVKDPEMDYAAKLYKSSPSALSKRVEEIYKLRDPSIAATSPNHPPNQKSHFWNRADKAASQSIKYDVIA